MTQPRALVRAASRKQQIRETTLAVQRLRHQGRRDMLLGKLEKLGRDGGSAKVTPMSRHELQQRLQVIRAEIQAMKRAVG